MTVVTAKALPPPDGPATSVGTVLPIFVRNVTYMTENTQKGECIHNAMSTRAGQGVHAPTPPPPQGTDEPDWKLTVTRPTLRIQVTPQ